METAKEFISLLITKPNMITLYSVLLFLFGLIIIELIKSIGKGETNE